MVKCVSRTVRKRLLAFTSISLLALAHGAFAQEGDNSPPGGDAWPAAGTLDHSSHANMNGDRQDGDNPPPPRDGQGGSDGNRPPPPPPRGEDGDNPPPPPPPPHHHHGKSDGNPPPPPPSRDEDGNGGPPPPTDGQ